MPLGFGVQRQKNPLRPLTAAERSALEQIARAGSERADRATRSKALLAVADGQRFTDAARSAGRRSGDAVAHLVRRFTTAGLAALAPRHAGGPPVVYDATTRERILREFRRPPDRERDGAAAWSLATLQRALRRAPDGLPTVSTWTILQTLWAAGYTWQASRTWCHTGTVVRKRKRGSATVAVTVTDPDATPKKK
jgi:Homeodomain-like domain